jgi:hypothetical protein
MNRNLLLSRNWWDKLTSQQIQEILIESSKNQWKVLSTGQVESICLQGLVANPVFSVGIDQVQQLKADFEITCDSGKTKKVIKINLTFVDFNSTNLLFETLTSLSESNNPYIWIKGKAINFPEITILVKEWGKRYEDLKCLKSKNKPTNATKG